MSGKNKKMVDRLFKKYKNLQNKFLGKIKIGDNVFVLFDVVYERHNYRTKGARDMIKRNVSKEGRLNKLLKENPGCILIAHNPPYGYLDQLDTPCMPGELKGKHVGSKILLRAIKKHHPKLVLCGHIHEAKGRIKIGKSEVVNLGYRGDYEIFDL